MRLRNVCAATVALAFLPLAGCGWFDDPTPQEARVSLDGVAGELVEMIISKQFITGISSEQITQVELFDADTLVRPIPFDTLISIKEEQRFFIRTIDADTLSSQVRMQVFIDGSSRYDQQLIVTVEQMLFLFAFNQPITAFVELL